MELDKKPGGSKVLIGYVRFIRRYPVKSMRGEDLKEAQIKIGGLEGDRTFAFIDANSKDETFPWMTARQAHEMLLYTPRFTQSGSIDVICPDKTTTFSLTDPKFKSYLEQKYRYELTLRHDEETHCFDSKPVSLIGLDTVRTLAEETSLSDLDHRRFRANLYIDFQNRTPFYEDTLVGSSIQIGEGGARLKIVEKDSRCIIPTLDPLTSKPSPIVLETIQRKHGGCVAVYSLVEKEAVVRQGDAVFLLELM
jgi:uncharacterized protein